MLINITHKEYSFSNNLYRYCVLDLKPICRNQLQPTLFDETSNIESKPRLHLNWVIVFEKPDGHSEVLLRLLERKDDISMRCGA